MTLLFWFLLIFLLAGGSFGGLWYSQRGNTAGTTTTGTTVFPYGPSIGGVLMLILVVWLIFHIVLHVI